MFETGPAVRQHQPAPNPITWYEQRGASWMLPTHEEWRTITGQEGQYEVSNLGRVRSLDRLITTKAGVIKRRQGQILKPFKGDRYGHQVVSFGKRDRHYVHTIVLETFVGPRPAGAEACHGDGDVFNNQLSNLRWDTPSSNQLDRAPHGTHHNAQKTHCVNGHEFTPENIRWKVPSGPKYVNPRPSRECRTCIRERYHARKVA